MKRLWLTVLSLICGMSFICGCGRNGTDCGFQDFVNYKDDFEAVVHYVIDFPPHTINTIISTYTIDLDQGIIEIDNEHRSPDSLNPSIKRIFDKGFTFIEVDEEYMIFWYDNMSYGVLWTKASAESLSRLEELESYQELSDGWYEVECWCN